MTAAVVCLIKLCVTEGMDSSATDSGTEDVLSSQLFAGTMQKKFQDHTVSHDERQPRQYRTKKLDNDSDWLSKRSGSDMRTGRKHKVLSILYYHRYFPVLWNRPTSGVTALRARFFQRKLLGIVGIDFAGQLPFLTRVKSYSKCTVFDWFNAHCLLQFDVQVDFFKHYGITCIWQRIFGPGTGPQLPQTFFDFLFLFLCFLLDFQNLRLCQYATNRNLTT